MEILLEHPSLKTMATFYTNRIENMNNRPHSFFFFFQLLRWNSQQKSVNSVNFSRVLPTSRLGYHAGKPIESVVYCLNILSRSVDNVRIPRWS